MSKAQTSPVAPVDGKKLLRTIRRFQRESLAGAYYTPFNMNSKNYRYIPPETEAWFDRLGELLASSAQLTQQKDHRLATACFGLLFELIDAMESSKEIVFADEIGSGAAIAVRSGCHPRDDIVQVDQPSRAHRHSQ